MTQAVTDAMKKFSSVDLQRNSGLLQEAALREPVAITHHGRPRLVVMHVDEYERLKRRDRRAVRIEHISEEFKALLDQQAAGESGDTVNWGEEV
jgi:prevent-host-death family protein